MEWLGILLLLTYSSQIKIKAYAWNRYGLSKAAFFRVQSKHRLVPCEGFFAIPEPRKLMSTSIGQFLALLTELFEAGLRRDRLMGDS